MDAGHWYQSTIVDRGHDLELDVVVLPTRSFEDPEAVPSQKDILGTLEIVRVRTLATPQQMAYALLGAFVGSDAKEIAGTVEWCEAHVGQLPPGLGILPSGRMVNPQPALDFAFDALEAELIPFEHSPLGAEALGKLVTAAAGKGSPAVIGSLIGAVAAGPTPVILITVPAGIVICFAAVGLGEAIRAGIREGLSAALAERLRNLMGIPRRRRGGGGSAPTAAKGHRSAGSSS